MVSYADLFQGILDNWEDEPCPYCGKPAEPWFFSVVRAYSIHCNACDKVLEAFDLEYQDDGEPYLENHYRAIRTGEIVALHAQ